MDFQLSEEQVLLRDTTRDLLSRSYDPESRNKAIASDLGWSREVWTQLAETGILGLGFDPDESGQIEVITVLTEVGRRLAPEPVVHAALGPGRSSPRRAATPRSSCSTRSPRDSDCWRSRTWNLARAGRLPKMLRQPVCNKVMRGC